MLYFIYAMCIHNCRMYTGIGFAQPECTPVAIERVCCEVVEAGSLWALGNG